MNWAPAIEVVFGTTAVMAIGWAGVEHFACNYYKAWANRLQSQLQAVSTQRDAVGRCRDGAEADLSRVVRDLRSIKAKRSAATSQGNRTRAAKRRALVEAKRQELAS
jgi:hypothetical protein